jgi:hypothetical protein
MQAANAALNGNYGLFNFFRARIAGVSIKSSLLSYTRVSDNKHPKVAPNFEERRRSHRISLLLTASRQNAAFFS